MIGVGTRSRKKMMGNANFPIKTALLHYNFKKDKYFNNGSYLTRSSAMTHARTGVAESFASDGTSLNPQTPANTPRINSKGLLIEQGNTNNILNNSFVGLVPGSPGTLPSSVSLSAPTGLTRTLSTEIIGGVSYMRVRYQGTATSTSSISIALETGYMSVVQNDNAAAQSLFQSINDIGLTGDRRILLEIWSYTAGLGFLSTGSAPTSGQYLDADFTSRTLKNLVTTRLLSEATVGNAKASWRTNSTITSGTVCDIEFRIGLGQLVKSANPTSPIVTSGSAVTRNTESLTATLSPGSNYCIAGVLSCYPFSTINQMPFVLGIDVNNVIRLRRSSGDASILQFESMVASVGQGSASSPASALVNGQLYGFSARCESGILAICINGGVVNTATPTSLPAAPTNIYIGQQGAGTNPFNDYIQQFAVFGSGKTNAEMQYLSTVSNWK